MARMAAAKPWRPFLDSICWISFSTGCDLVFVQAFPVHQIANFGSIALSQSNAIGVAVKFTGGADEGVFSSFESADGHFQLMMKLSLVAICPAFRGLSSQEVGDRSFDPRSVLQAGILES